MSNGQILISASINSVKLKLLGISKNLAANFLKIEMKGK